MLYSRHTLLLLYRLSHALPAITGAAGLLLLSGRTAARRTKVNPGDVAVDCQCCDFKHAPPWRLPALLWGHLYSRNGGAHRTGESLNHFLDITLATM
eukprot:249677-Chlamydomonas_euryale.AAC.1